MATDVDDVETTKGERLLALVLGVFLLIGGIWVYDKLDRGDGYRPPEYSVPAQRNVDAHAAARERLSRAQETLQRETRELELAREDYRVALEADRPADELRAAYLREQREQRAAQEALDRAADRERETRAAADEAQRQAFATAEEERRQDAWVTFALRLAFVLAALGAAFWTFVRLRGSRYGALAGGGLLAVTALAFGMAVDYVGDYVAWQDLGPLVLSLVGAALTLVAFWALQRYLARRLPQRRVRRGECPYCGYPVRGTAHCEGCGREVAGRCASCESPRRVGTPHCGVCGAR